MNIRFVLFVIFYFIFINAYSQNLINGKVVDEKNNSIPFVFLNCITSRNEFQVKSDSTGKFSFSLPLNDNFEIEVRRLNFNHFREKYLSSNKYLIIQLISDTAFTLPTLIVKNQSIEEKGDTTSYVIKEFANKGDLYLGDVIGKLPGITKSDNGILFYNGKQIQNLLIENQNLLGGNYGIANDVIRHQLINKIEVIRNYNPININKGFNNDNVAINIKFKDEAKNINVGQSNFAVNTFNPIDNIGITLMLFKSKIQYLNTLNLNNQWKGNTFNDDIYFLKENQLENIITNNLQFPKYSLSNFENPIVDKYRWSDMRSKDISTNLLFKNTNNNTYKVNLQYSNKSNITESSIHNELYFTNNIFQVDRHLIQSAYSEKAHITLTNEVNTDKKYLLNTFEIIYKNDKKDENSSLAERNNIFQYQSVKKIDLIQNLQGTILIKKSLKFNFKFITKLNQFKDFDSIKIIDKHSFINQLQDNYNINNLLYSSLRNTINNFSFEIFINNYTSFKYGVADYKNLLDTSLLNSVNSNRNKLYFINSQLGLKLSYKYQNTNINFNLPISYMNYNENFFKVNNHSFKLLYNFNIDQSYRNFKLRFYNKINQNIYNIDDYINVPYFANYYTYIKPLSFYEDKSNITKGFVISYENPLKGIFVNYSNSIANVFTNVIQNYNSNQSLILLNYEKIYNSKCILMQNYSFGKYFIDLRTSVKLNYYITNSNNNILFNTNIKTSEIKAKNFTIEAYTKYLKNVYFESKFSNLKSITNFQNQNDKTFILNKFENQFMYSFLNNTIGIQSQSFEDNNLNKYTLYDLFYTLKKSKYTLKFKIINLLNKHEFITNVQDAFSIEKNIIYFKSRILSADFTYNF